MDDLDRARLALDDLAVERDRILAEHESLRFWSVGSTIGQALGLDTRSDSVLALLDRIDHFVAERFADVEREAVGPPVNAAAAARLLQATRNILATVRGVQLSGEALSHAQDASASAEIVVNASKQVDDELKKLYAQLGKLLGWLPWIAGGLAALIVGSWVVRLLPPPRR